jgi:8-oxo-dGTP pyrophosphatase MutT (NUDIX family)
MTKKKVEREVSAGGIVFRRNAEGVPHFLLIRDSYRHWGFPKGHLEDEETPAEAAIRETREETGLEQLTLHGPIRLIDWHFRFRGRYIHKFCHFFLFESEAGEATPQVDEGITAVRWEPLDRALEVLSYDNARGVLRRAAEMARCLVAVGRGRPAPRPEPLHSGNGGDKA